MSDQPPLPMARLTLAQSAELQRRRRGRNLALLIALSATAALFYLIAMAKIAQSGAGG